MRPREYPLPPKFRTTLLLCTLILVFGYFNSPLLVHADDLPAPITLTPGNHKIPITQSAQYLLLDKAINADEISSSTYDRRWMPYHGQGITSYGDNDDLWLRFTVRTEDVGKNDWWLVIHWPVINHAQLSSIDNATQVWQHYLPIGVTYPRSNEIIQDRNFIFPLNLNAQGEQTYYLNIRAQGLLSVPISLWPAEEFNTWNQIDLIVIGGILGALAIMLFYNLSLSVLLKDRVYYYYCIYVASVILYLTTIMGIGPFYLWPDSAWLNKYAVYLTSISCFAAATVFVRFFLRLPKHGGWLLFGNNFLLILWASWGFGLFIVPLDIVELLINITSFIATIIAIATGVVLWKRNFPTAKIFVISWGVLIFSTFIFVLSLQGAIPFNLYTRYSQMLGFAVELVLLSVALAYRINLEITEREAAQSEALLLTKKVSEERRERLKAQMETLEVQRQLNEELEQHVVERTEQLNDAMLKLENANAELTKLSVTDPLTKLHNRRYFDDTLINEYKRALRSNQSLGIIVADIDHFKSINDTYGHGVGDQCIAAVAQALKTSIHRPGDLVARYGGEEFVFVLPGSDEKNALNVANNCRSAVEALEFTADGKSIPLTISAGIAAWIPSEEGAYKQLLNAADTALYRAKNSGRNCVKAASERGKLAQI